MLHLYVLNKLRHRFLDDIECRHATILKILQFETKGSLEYRRYTMLAINSLWVPYFCFWRISVPIRFLHISYTVLLFIEAACGQEKRLEIMFLLMKLTRNRCCWRAQYILPRVMALTLSVLPALVNVCSCSSEGRDLTPAQIFPSSQTTLSPASLVYLPLILLVSWFI